MRKAITWLSFLILSVGHLIAVEIKGEVLTPEGKPIQGAVVLHRLSQSKAVTDEKGQFNLKTPDGEKVKLEIIHPDYMDQEKIFSLLQASKKISIRLTPLIRQREEIVVTALRYPESSA